MPSARSGPIFLFILASVVWVLIGPAQALTVTQARLGEEGPRLRLVLEADRPVSPAVSMRAQGREIILRFNENVAWQAPTALMTRQGWTASVATGTKQESRDTVIVGVSSPVSVRTAFTLPADAQHPVRIVIDLDRTPAAAVGAGVGMLGTLVLRPQPKPVLAEPIANEPNMVRMATPPSGVPRARAADKPARRPVIVIDAGHGGKDTGAIGVSGVREKDVTLRAARIVERALSADGRYDVVLTRTSDVFIRLGDRVAIARRHKADLFISLHADSLPPGRPHVRGASIYTISDKASDEQTAKLATRENKADLIGGIDLQHEDKDIADILVDLAMRDTQNQSRTFANTVVASFDGKNVRLLERPHRYAGFAVLKAPDIPSVLLEMGFMSSPKDEQLLRTDDFLHQIARALHRAIDDYFTALDVSMMQ